jgi:hypothetical protein
MLAGPRENNELINLERRPTYFAQYTNAQMIWIFGINTFKTAVLDGNSWKYAARNEHQKQVFAY